MVLTGRRLSADEAPGYGPVSRVVDAVEGVTGFARKRAPRRTDRLDRLVVSSLTTGVARVRAIVLSGGLTHDFPATTARLTALLDASGLAAEVHTEVDAALAALPGAALLVVNALRWSMTGPGTPDRYRARAAAEGASPSGPARAALDTHLAAGGGVLGMHTAAICFDDWPAWGARLGGAWEWERS